MRYFDLTHTKLNKMCDVNSVVLQAKRNRGKNPSAEKGNADTGQRSFCCYITAPCRVQTDYLKTCLIKNIHLSFHWTSNHRQSSRYPAAGGGRSVGGWSPLKCHRWGQFPHPDRVPPGSHRPVSVMLPTVSMIPVFQQHTLRIRSTTSLSHDQPTDNVLLFLYQAVEGDPRWPARPCKFTCRHLMCYCLTHQAYQSLFVCWMCVS